MEEKTQQSSGYGKRPLWQWILIYVLLGAVVYGLIYYFVFARRGGYNSGGSGYQYPTSQQVTVQPTVTSSAASPVTSSATQIIVSGTDFAFTPSTIVVKVGQSVQITFKNMGQYPHNFTISELNVQTKTIEPGQETTVTFTPNKTGSFTYVCTVPGHADRGMKGTLTVK